MVQRGTLGSFHNYNKVFKSLTFEWGRGNLTAIYFDLDVWWFMHPACPPRVLSSPTPHYHLPVQLTLHQLARSWDLLEETVTRSEVGRA